MDEKVVFISTALFFAACAKDISKNETDASEDKVVKTDEEWKKELTADEYAMLREKATEKAYKGEYDQFWDSGLYVCKACGNELFYSDTKFDAGWGWPSFYKSIDTTKIKEVPDLSFGMNRIEVRCARCGGHLGHVFDDGPDTTELSIVSIHYR